MARARRSAPSSRHWLSAFSHSIPPTGRPQSRQARLALRRVGVGNHAEAAEARHVLDHVARVAANRVRRLRHADGQVVPGAGADLHAVEHEDARAVAGRLGQSRAVAVVGEDHELQAGPRGGGGDLVDRAVTVGPVRVHVEGAAPGRARRAPVGLAEHQRLGRQQRGRSPAGPRRESRAPRRRPARHARGGASQAGVGLQRGGAVGAAPR